MTEAEWLSGGRPYRLIEFLRTRHKVNRTKSGRRKLRLIGCASCRHAWPLFEAEVDYAEVVRKVEERVDGGDSGEAIAGLGAGLSLPYSVADGFHFFAAHAARMLVFHHT